MITIKQLLESVKLDFEPRFVTKNYCGEITIFDSRPYIGCEEWCGDDAESRCFGPINLSEFANKKWQECIYEVPQKVKITDKIEELDLSVPNNKMLTDLEQIEIKINEVIDAVNKHADIIQQIGDWGTRKGECLWCEKLTSVNLGE